MLHARLVLLTAVLAAGCHRSTPNDLATKPVHAVRDPAFADATSVADAADVPAGSLRAARAHLAFAVYYLPKARRDPLATLRSLPEASDFPILTALPTTRPDAPTLIVLSPTIEEAPPPAPQSLKYAVRELDDAQQKALLASSEVTALVFEVSGEGVNAGYAKALKIVGALARLTGGLPWDTSTRQVFSLEEWQKRADAFENGVPTVAKHIRIDMYREGELLRLVTLGMEKMALPDVAMNDVTGSDGDSMGALLNLLCQSLAERGALDEAGEVDLAVDGIKSVSARAHLRFDEKAKTRVLVHLAVGHRQEGDDDNRRIDVVFPGPPDTLQERQGAAIVDLFGGHDEVVHVDHDAELLAASARARAKLMAMKPVWSKSIPDLERLLVKAPFRTRTGGNEWMWVELTSWQGTTIRGVLQNDPFEVSDLRAGARVAVEEGAIFDYIWVKADGTREGNETGGMMGKR